MRKTIKVVSLLTLIFSFSPAKLLKIPKRPLTFEEKKTCSEIIKRARMFKSRVSKRLLPRIRASAMANKPDTLRVLALRVEFVEDDDSLTTGNGKMDLKGVGRPYDGLLYDPPHTKRYFTRLMQFLRNYYRANSLGRLEIEWDVMPEGEFDSYQLPRKLSYYGHALPYFPTYDDFETMERGLCRLFRDAIKVADRDPKIDFSKYDAIIIFHAGSAWQTTNRPLDLWAGTIDSSALHYYLGKPYILANEGRWKIYDAALIPEMARMENYMSAGVEGILVHEFAHLLGAYDLYDVTHYTQGVGGWDIMGSGGYLGYPPGVIPAMHSAFHKLYLGWLPDGTVDTIQIPTKDIPLHCSELDSSDFSKSPPIILMVPISPKEYFLIENREQDTKKKDTLIVDVEDGVPIYIGDGEWDSYLPGSGVLIWHIDERIVEDNGPTNTINIPPPWLPHKGVDLEEADAVQDFDVFYPYSESELIGNSFDAFFKGGYNDSFTPSTNPNSDGYEGKSFISIRVHSPPDTVMRVSVDFDLYQKGFPKILSTKQRFLSPNYGDLDGDGNYELVVPTTSGYIYAWRSDGSSYTQDEQGIFASLPDSIPSTIAVGDITQDGKADVVVGCEDGKVYAFYGDSLLGKRAARISGFPVSTKDRITSSPLLADIDGDGTLDVVIGSTDMSLYAWNGKGEAIKGFPVWLGSEVRSTPAIMDEKNPEIVVLGADNRLFLIDRDGKIKKGFPVVLSQSPNYAVGSPVIADFDGDGERDIAVIAADGTHYRLFLLDTTGNIKFKGAQLLDMPCNTSPAVGDINQDGLLDIVVAGKNKVYALNYNGTLLDNFPIVEDSLFAVPKIIEIEGQLYIIEFEFPYIFNSSPLIADGILIGSPEYGVLGYDSLARPLPYTPLFSSSGINSTGLLIDLDRDGDMEFCTGSDSGVLYVWDLPLKSQNFAWGCFLSDPCHTGIYRGELPTPFAGSSPLISDFYVYPNPCGYGAKFRYKLGKDVEEAKIGVLDISGKLLFEEKLKELSSGPYNEFPLDFSAVPPGVYILRFEVKMRGEREVKFYKLGVVR